MSEHELLISLLDAKTKIENCGESFIIRATIRQRAAALAAAFVDSAWAIQEQFVTHPPLRDGKAMSLDIDQKVGF